MRAKGGGTDPPSLWTLRAPSAFGGARNANEEDHAGHDGIRTRTARAGAQAQAAAVTTPVASGAKPRIGLALAGGGPLGGIYEVGALLALADSLDGLDFNDLDVYVGVSSGGFVAAALANGISPAQMYRLFIDDGADAALKPEIFLRPALRRVRRRMAALPGLAARATLQYLRDPFHRGVHGVVRDALARDADRRVRQPRDRRLPAPGCSRRPAAPTTSAS